MGTLKTAITDWIRVKTQSGTPATPASGYGIFYDKNKAPAFKNSDGTEFLLAAGAGDVVGPASSVAGHLAVFGDTTGKTLADGGISRALLLDQTLSSDGTFDTDPTSLTGYKDLEIFIEARGTRADILDYFLVYFNADTTDANYASSPGGGSVPEAGMMPAGNSPTNSFGYAHFYIQNYAGTAHTKVLQCESGGLTDTNAVTIRPETMAWKSTAAITRIRVQGAVTANFLSGSRMRVYGVA